MSSVFAKATFGAGCFWGVEHFFREINGVKDAVCGYMGGELENPSYPEVKTGNTGHAEVVEVTYDPAQVSYRELVHAFFANHNPTTLNRQGEDEGSQYRSAIFFQSSDEQSVATEVKQALQESGKWGQKPIVTEISEASEFYEAEEYHQSYLAKNELPSCHISFGDF
ncbi:peptide-methionine (S)-S-oxide reductase MsrA [Paraferrimonas sedimenticola]|uniref:Peptide methionine sulfoxide reductase MsrA n=1 Tax=Paraferrimonas sedimenticola TaxID=375674 RepID=A0AA37RVX2_9GAMM|nr:peptide-methionine (S)-S-oxide reductase MsrA [Paraferrimonas sedimenticola]GLP96246.1 peptide methionine sulfoxide reductase MsrA [Paraferrimonas sedimenticola]